MNDKHIIPGRFIWFDIFILIHPCYPFLMLNKQSRARVTVKPVIGALILPWFEICVLRNVDRVQRCRTSVDWLTTSWKISMEIERRWYVRRIRQSQTFAFPVFKRILTLERANRFRGFFHHGISTEHLSRLAVRSTDYFRGEIEFSRGEGKGQSDEANRRITGW